METRTHIDVERLHLLAARLKLWVLDLCVWLAEWLGHALPRDVRIDLRADVRGALCSARMIVVMLALAQWLREDVAVPVQVHALRPLNAPRVFRRSSDFGDNVRGLKRAVRLHGRTLAQRLHAVRCIFEDIDVWTARMLRRLRRHPHGARLVLCFAVSELLREFGAIRTAGALAGPVSQTGPPYAGEAPAVLSSRPNFQHRTRARAPALRITGRLRAPMRPGAGSPAPSRGTRRVSSRRRRRRLPRT